MSIEKHQAILFDWGNTVMRDFPSFAGPMHGWPKVEEVPGIRSALEFLSRTSIIALATNAADSDEADIRKALIRCNLSGFFDFVFCFRQVGYRKPEPAFYRTVLETLGLPASSVFMVGDSFDDDVRAAYAVGISAVWFNPVSKQSESGPRHRTVQRHEDLSSALRELGARMI